MKHMVAFDCGNSSFRVVLGTYDDSKITMEVVSQTPNDMVCVQGRYFWDFLAIFQSLKRGLQEAIRRAGHVDSIGICTWGVDFGLYDSGGFLLGNPLSYRNSFGAEYLRGIPPQVQQQMYFDTGILCDKINSVNMLSAMKAQMPGIINATEKLLMVPDILNYMFTGKMINEPSELSTTQLMDSRTGKISPAMCQRFDIPESYFSPIGKHGEAIGMLLPEIREELGISYDIPVICVPSHDTAAAVFGIPAQEEQFLFLSSGTWSLIGTELSAPIVSEQAMAGNLTNEVGAFGKITLLRNNAGMFINQCLKPEYTRETGKNIGWMEFSALGQAYQGDIPLINVNDERFFKMGHMTREIRSALKQSGQVKDDASWPAIVRTYQASLACSYAAVVAPLEKLTGQTYPCLYVVGGGSQNVLQNQMTADLLNKEVVVCSKESTSLGNLAMQISYFEAEKSVQDIRNILASSIDMKRYQPEHDCSELFARYQAMFA